jgi:hypothetical protein
MAAIKQRLRINVIQTAMMKRNTRYAAACLALLVIAGVVAGFTFSVAPKAELLATRAEESVPAQVNEIRGYRSWTLVNPQPVYISSRLDMLCRLPSAEDQQAETARNPHARKRISVYVNALGQQAMLTERNPKFPIGSVIVKEKVSPFKENAPELLTVMIKRERGFNPASGDWEYMVVDGTGTRTQARGKLENCQACHVPLKYTDYVSRSYMPRDVRSKLK